MKTISVRPLISKLGREVILGAPLTPKGAYNPQTGSNGGSTPEHPPETTIAVISDWSDDDLQKLNVSKRSRKALFSAELTTNTPQKGGTVTFGGVTYSISGEVKTYEVSGRVVGYRAIIEA